MKSPKVLKLIMSLFLLVLSPLAVAGIASVIFIAIQFANGKNLAEGIIAIEEIFRNLSPFLPYITGIPAALVVFFIGFKNRSEMLSRFKK